MVHQVQNLSKPREVDPLLRFQRMPFKEGNNPFGEVIQPPDPVSHSIAVILPNHATAEISFQRVKKLDVTSMLNDREFGEHLKWTGHFRVRVDADVETTFAVNETHDPESF